MYFRRITKLLFPIRPTFNNRNVVATAFTFSSYKPTERNAIALKSNENDYLRSVLSKYRGCVLVGTKIDVRQFLSSTPEQTSDECVWKQYLQDDLVQKLSKIARQGFTSHPKAVSQLERKCFLEYKLWPIEKQLYVLDLWNHVPQSNKNESMWLLRNELLERFPDLSQDQTLQTMYYVTRLPKRIPEKQQKIIEARFLNDFDSMTFDAVSIWCLALFKSGAQIKSTELIQKIYRRLLENRLKNFHEIGLCSVLKIIGTSSTAHQALHMKRLMEKFSWHVKNSDLMLVSQIAFVGSNLKIHNADLLEAIVVRMTGEVHEMRFKDLKRICFVLSTFAHKSNATTTFLEKVSQHLLTVEKLAYVDSVIRCIEYILRCGVYDAQLIAWALEQRKTIDVFDVNIHSALLNIDMFAKINFADKYSGPSLSDTECAVIARKRIDAEKEDWSHLHSIARFLKASGQNCVVAHALPNFITPDILLVDASVEMKFIAPPNPGKPIQAADLTSSYPQKKAIAIVDAGASQYLFGWNDYAGYFRCKLQQLAILGYDVIVIPWTCKTDDERKQFLKKKIAKE